MAHDAADPDAPRPDGRIRQPDGARRRRPNGARSRATGKMDAYSPIPIEELNEALGLRANAAAAARAARRHPRRPRRLQPRVLGVGDRLPDEHRRPPAPQLAAVHPGDVRDDGARRGAHGVRRHVGAEQAAACRITRCSTCRRSAAPRRDRFFLCIEATDPKFDRARDASRFSKDLHPVGVSEVAP